MAPSDEQLVKEFLAGRGDAFDRLVERWDKRVLNLAYRFFGDANHAEDVRQEVFMTLYLKADRFSSRATFSTWFHRLIFNKCKDLARRRRRRFWASLKNGELKDGIREIAAPGPQAWQSADREYIAEVAREGLAAIPVKEREVVILRHYEGMTFPKIAAILRVPETTAKSRLKKGLEHLRDHFHSKNISWEDIES